MLDRTDNLCGCQQFQTNDEAMKVQERWMILTGAAKDVTKSTNSGMLSGATRFTQSSGMSWTKKWVGKAEEAMD